MCGICGVIRFDRIGEHERELAAQMAPLMRHRGPDGVGFWSDHSAAFGHTRLAIIDIAGGLQPMLNRNGLVAVVFNGEIYNYRELRQELERAGAEFRTSSDTEVLLLGYCAWGESVFERLNGMFAVAIRDAEQDLVLLARDRYGEKPLYVREAPDGQIAFASEIKALFADKHVARRMNSNAFGEYLAFRSVGSGQTLFDGIGEIPPATIRVYRRERQETRSFWKLDVPVAGRHIDEPQQMVEQLLFQATERRLISDVPIGSIISGGLDSSLVTAMAMRSAGALDTFCVGFKDQSLDERPFAREMARHIGSRHHELTIGDDVFLETLMPLTWAHDVPLTHPNAVPMHLLFRFAREKAGVKVVLSGEGADELFGGYDWYRSVSRRPTMFNSQVLDAVARAIPPLASLRGFRRVLRADYPLEANAVTPLDRLERLGLNTNQIRSSRRSLYATERRGVDASYIFDQRTYLPPLLQRQDRMSMAAGVEARVIFLDHILAEAVNALPDEVKRSRGVSKALLREAARYWLPESILERRKMGFALPLTKWLSRGGALFGLRDYLRDTRALSAEFLSAKQLLKLIDGDVSKDIALADLLWSLISLEIWRDIFLGSKVKPFELSGARLAVPAQSSAAMAQGRHCR